MVKFWELLKNDKEYLMTEFLVNSFYHDFANELQDVFFKLMYIDVNDLYYENHSFFFEIKSKHCQHIISSSLDYLKNGIKKNTFNIEALIKESFCFLDLKPNIETNKTHLAYADEDSVYRIFYNILNNSKKREGTNIKANITNNNDYIIITFSNEDTIIKEDSEKRKRYGLQISKRIIEDNNGKILAYNIPKNPNIEHNSKNNFAVFQIYLPKAK